MNLVNVIALLLRATISIVAEISAQTIVYISVFLLAVPVVFFKSPISLVENGEAENLTAIQQGLYSSNPLLLLMSVTSLLVALIGAAVIFAKQFLMLTIIITILFALLAIAFFTIAERKLLASIQRRKGPNVTGF